MTKKKLGRVLLMLVALFVAGGFFNGTKRAPVAEAATVPGKGTPSIDIVNVFGVYISTGYTLQPQDEYTYIGHAKTLTATLGHPFIYQLDLIHKDSFQWYQSTNSGAKWTKVSGATSSSLTVKPTTAGTVYYQLQDNYGLALIAPSYYSRVASITTSGAAVSATSLKATADDDYLYNNQKNALTTFVHASPTPANATGDVTWASDDTSLATVDKTTGQVTANKNEKSGTVHITGTITNDDGTTKSGSVAIQIGGGLDDQTVTSGDAATFTLRGSSDQTPTSIVWHKVDTSGKDTVVSSGTSLNYTTPAATAADNGSKYYAVITTTEEGQTNTMTTNQATLKVNVDHTPKVSFTSKITDVTDNTGNTDTELNNVLAGDVGNITGTFTDSNPDSTVASADFMIKMPGEINNTTLKIDGKVVQYGIQVVGSEAYMTVGGIDMSKTKTKTHSFELTFTSLATGNATYVTHPEIQAYDSNGEELDVYQGDGLTINTSDGSLSAKAGNVTFGSLSYADVNENIEGQIVGGGDLLDVTDNRRDRSGATTISLEQTDAFRTADGSHTLNATLSYSNGSRVIPLTGQGSQNILNAGPGIKVGSLNASHGQKLLLNMASQAIYTGSYSSTLDWTITTAPS